jgi:RNA polymerase sigma factor (sigma-70 family)
VEVSTLSYSRGIGLHGRSPLLRLQSDERLIAYVRRGNHHAFEVLVARYQSRLLSFCRHLLGSREDAEDVLQEVMAAAFNAILADDRPINVRPWLYRIARNRSLNHLRRIQAVGVDSMDVHLSENGLSTADKVHEREEFRVLVEDIHDLPETQRTALVLREMDALSYEQIAEAMETTVSSVKSLLVRARVSLAEAAEARLLSCDEVRIELGEVAEGLRRRPSSLVRRHLRSCKRCSSFKVQLRETNKALTALLPIGPMVFVLRKLALVHLGHSAGAGAGTGATGAAGVGGTAAAGAGATAAVGSAGGILSAGVGAIATKAAAGLAAAALVTAGAVEVSQRPTPTRATATHHHPLVVATLPPAPPPAPVAHSHQSFQSTVVELPAKKHDVNKAAASKAADNAAKPADKTPDPTTTTTTPTTTTPTTTTTTPAPTEPPGRQQTQTDPTVLPPAPTPTATTPPATTTPAPTMTTPPPTTTTPATPTTSTPSATTPIPTTPTTTTPVPPPDQPPAGSGSATDPVTVPPTAAPLVDSFASAPPHHRHRRHGIFTW